MYKTIIVPIDLAHGERADSMIAAAKQLAGDGSKLVLTNIVEDVPAYVASELPGGILEQSRKQAEEKLAELVANAGIHAEVEVRSGQPAAAILAVAEERKADLIVIASHRPGWGDFLIGSTAARVVRHAPCSVHVIR